MKLKLQDPPEGFSEDAEYRSPKKGEWYIEPNLMISVKADEDFKLYEGKRIVLTPAGFHQDRDLTPTQAEALDAAAARPPVKIKARDLPSRKKGIKE